MKFKQILLIIAVSAVSAVGSVALYNKISGDKVVTVGTAQNGLPVNYAGFFDGKTGTPAEGLDFTRAANAAVPAVVHIKTKIPAKKVTKQEAEIVTLGSTETANHRTLNMWLVAGVVETCQLQMGMTELKTGSVWNTLPAHTHDRRMEVYLYFEVPEGQAVCHFMGQPQETRHIFVHNEQAVISPPWSIHSGAGTSNYTFIWGMAGENMDYGDMDGVAVTGLR